jgi:hypothetical protein
MLTSPERIGFSSLREVRGLFQVVDVYRCTYINPPITRRMIST